MNKQRILLDKTLVIAIILLFVFMSITPSIAIDNVEKSSMPISGNTLYVGGSGPGNYSKIMDAVENATDGDTVFVYDDSSPYEDESLNINKSIILQGENMTTTIVCGWGNINSDFVVISGFTFQDCGPALVIDGFSNNIIENCAFNGSAAGLALEGGSDHNIIRNCSFKYLEFVCLSISSSNKNEISYCDFFDNNGWMVGNPAISVFGSRGIKIHHCNITRNYQGGVSIIFSDVQMTDNNIFNNGGPGVELGFLSSCDLRYNWWGSPQGPNIIFKGRFGRQFIIRQVDNSDSVYFWGRLLIVEFIELIRLLPWLSEPVADAGQQT